MPKTVQKNRKQWAAEIRAANRQGVRGHPKNRPIADCRKAGRCRTGEFRQMIEQDLPFGLRTAQMLMAIAKDRRLSNAKIPLLCRKPELR